LLKEFEKSQTKRKLTRANIHSERLMLRKSAKKKNLIPSGKKHISGYGNQQFSAANVPL
jgi:hypothetical protein